MVDKRTKTILAGLGLTTATVALASYLYLRLVKHKSLTGLTVNRFIENRDWKEQSEDLITSDFDHTLAKLTEENRKAVKNPFALFLKNHQEYLVAGMQVFSWNDNGSDDQDILIYFHGGGYIFQPFDTQYFAINQIAKKSDCRVIMPIYPKAPEYTFKDAFPALLDLYKAILDKKGEKASVTIIGDSAGGGLALGFAHALVDHQLDQPDHLVLICPWLDLTNSHPDIEKANQKEQFFGLHGLEQAARYWAGDQADRTHKYVTPKLADPSVIDSHITIFTGTDETFYVDILDFVKQLDALGKDYDFEIGQGQYHVYPLYPTLEGHQARDKIVDIITDK